jgi:hypothetical protein
MSDFAVKKNNVPETKTGDVGTAKRNIIRKNSGSRGGGGGGSGTSRKEGSAGQSVDDGSLYIDGSALDENDPNYDSEEETAKRTPIPGTAPLSREEIAKSKLTLTQYKKKIQPIINDFLSSFVIDDVALSLQV